MGRSTGRTKKRTKKAKACRLRWQKIKEQQAQMSAALGIPIGTTKHCVFGGCNSDSRYDPRIKFVSFRKGCIEVRKRITNVDEKHLQTCNPCATCHRWMQMSNRTDERFKNVANINKHTYICCKHFVDENGPTHMYPDPLPPDTVMEIRNYLQNETCNAKEDINTCTSIDPLAETDAKRICIKTDNTGTDEFIDTEIVKTELSDVYTDNQQQTSFLDEEVEVKSEYLDEEIEVKALEVTESFQNSYEQTEATSLQVRDEDGSYQTTIITMQDRSVQTRFCFKDSKKLKMAPILRTRKLSKTIDKKSGKNQLNSELQKCRLEKKRIAEYLRRQKIRNDPKAYEIYCEKERARNEKRKKEGKLKLIHQLSDREKQVRRKQQNEWKKNSRARQKRIN